MLQDFKFEEKNNLPISSKKLGFTLIELLVVISIIGLLSSVVLASLNSARKKAITSKYASELKELQKAILAYKVNTGEDIFTPGLLYIYSNEENALEPLLQPLLDNNYIPAIPYYGNSKPTDLNGTYTTATQFSNLGYGYVCSKENPGKFQDALDSGMEGALFLYDNQDEVDNTPFENNRWLCYKGNDCTINNGSAQDCLPF